MKKLLTLLFSVFLLSSTAVFADDISDFQIEGISIGDSLLDYMTEDEILKEIEENRYLYEFLKNPDEFREVYLLDYKELQTYDNLTVFVQNNSTNKYITNNNEKFKIYAIRGIINFNDNIEECIKERNTIANVLSNIFKDAEKTEIDFNHSVDPSGNSKIYGIYFKLKSGNEVSVDCIDFEENLRINNNWSEGITVGITTVEFDDWISN